jgi:hypothetical protein
MCERVDAAACACDLWAQRDAYPPVELCLHSGGVCIRREQSKGKLRAIVVLCSRQASCASAHVRRTPPRTTLLSVAHSAAAHHTPPRHTHGHTHTHSPASSGQSRARGRPRRKSSSRPQTAVWRRPGRPRKRPRPSARAWRAGTRSGPWRKRGKEEKKRMQYYRVQYGMTVCLALTIRSFPIPNQQP